jgi:hypothetical protein
MNARTRCIAVAISALAPAQSDTDPIEGFDVPTGCGLSCKKKNWMS